MSVSPNPRHYLSSCDTIVAFTGSGEERHAVFAKNSDRQTLECQSLVQIPAADHRPDEMVPCQYIAVPQVPHTLAVLGSRPFWLWGLEQGVNEAGVAIGNEAIYTHDPVAETGLLGMDLVRLGLERGRTAAEAKRVITDLIERYGQGGNAVPWGERYYQSSFVVADATEAWVIETSRRNWVARRTTRGAVLSNLVTIEDDWDERSDGVEEHAREMGYWTAPASTPFDFRAAYEDRAMRSFVAERYEVGCRLLAERPSHNVAGMMRYLRDHFASGAVYALPRNGEASTRSVCAHAGSGPAGGTTASMIVELTGDDRPPVAWSSVAAPCTSVFLPVTLGEPLPPALSIASEQPVADSLWWAMRELQYMCDRDPALLTPIVQAAWQPIESELISGTGRLTTNDLAALAQRILARRDRLMIELTVAELAHGYHAMTDTGSARA